MEDGKDIASTWAENRARDPEARKVTKHRAQYFADMAEARLHVGAFLKALEGDPWADQYWNYASIEGSSSAQVARLVIKALISRGFEASEDFGYRNNASLTSSQQHFSVSVKDPLLTLGF